VSELSLVARLLQRNSCSAERFVFLGNPRACSVMRTAQWSCAQYDPFLVMSFPILCAILDTNQHPRITALVYISQPRGRCMRNTGFSMTRHGFQGCRSSWRAMSSDTDSMKGPHDNRRGSESETAASLRTTASDLPLIGLAWLLSLAVGFLGLGLSKRSAQVN
jgi:hypothetical protein